MSASDAVQLLHTVREKRRVMEKMEPQQQEGAIYEEEVVTRVQETRRERGKVRNSEQQMGGGHAPCM